MTQGAEKLVDRLILIAMITACATMTLKIFLADETTAIDWLMLSVLALCMATYIAVDSRRPHEETEENLERMAE